MYVIFSFQFVICFLIISIKSSSGSSTLYSLEYCKAKISDSSCVGAIFLLATKNEIKEVNNLLIFLCTKNSTEPLGVYLYDFLSKKFFFFLIKKVFLIKKKIFSSKIIFSSQKISEDKEAVCIKQAELFVFWD